MAKDHARIALHFGRWYMWLRNERGNLSMVAVDRVTDAVAEVAEAFRPGSQNGVTDSP